MGGCPSSGRGCGGTPCPWDALGRDVRPLGQLQRAADPCGVAVGEGVAPVGCPAYGVPILGE